MSRKTTDKKTRKRAIEMSKLLKTKRKKAGLSQADLSREANISSAVIKAIEQKKMKTPGFFIFLDLAKTLKIEWQEIKKL